MNILQILLLVLSLLLIVGTGFNFYLVISNMWASFWTSFEMSINLVTSIGIIIGVIRNLGKSYYECPLISLYLTDILSLITFIAFLVNDLFNYVKLINIVIITSLIVVVHICFKTFGVVYASSNPKISQKKFL